MPKNFLWGRTVTFIGDCGIYWRSQRAALIDPHRLRGAFFGLCSGKKHRDGARHFFPDPPQVFYSAYILDAH